MPSRFRFNRPGGFGPGDSWFRVGTLEVTTTLLVVGLGVLSMIAYAVDKVALLNLALIAPEVRNGEVWRIVTWPIYTEPDIWLALLLYVFWILGSEVERLLGRNRMAAFLGVTTLVSGIVATGLDLSVGGLRPIELMVLAVFAIEFPGAQFFFGINARIMAAVIIGLDLLQYTGDRAWEAFWFTLVTIAVGILLMRAFGFANDLPWLPRIPLPGTTKRRKIPKPPKRGPSKQPRGKRDRSHLSVAPQPPTAPPTHLPPDIDRLLDKIAADGIESLTPSERAQLDQASRRMRDQRE